MKNINIYILALLLALLPISIANAQTGTIILKSSEKPCTTTLTQNKKVVYRFSDLGKYTIAPGTYFIDMKCPRGTGATKEWNIRAGETVFINLGDDLSKDEAQSLGIIIHKR